jgi:ABC-type sugar transport system ATPase subunit
MSFLVLDALAKTYPDGTRAVDAIDLAIEQGEFIVLLGPSGCGKTTTLRMVAGLEQPSSGTIRLAGRDVTHARPSERDVGFVFQSYALYPHMSVAQNIAFPLAATGVPAAERRAAVAELAARLELEGLLDARPGQLSGGDQQRVALARAMVRRPAAWWMDEPLGTLDADRRMAMCELLRAQQLEAGVTTVYVTHDQEEALRLADRIVVMSSGQIVQAAAPAVVYDEPASLFVARFVGSPGMNLIAGEVRGGALHGEGGGVLPLAGAHLAGPAVLGVRPEALRLDSHGALRGRVRADEYQGSSRCLHVDTDLGPLVVRVAPEAAREVGAEIALTPDWPRVRWFDPATGMRRS